MSKANKRNRSSKREIITLDDEDSANEQPSKKNAKILEEDVILIDDDEPTDDQPVEKRREETVPSPNVVQLQQEVLKLKQDLNSSHLATRTAESRAEAAEKQLTKSQDMFQRACVAARTAELRAEAAESRLDSKYGIKDEFEAEKKRTGDLEKSVAEISSQLDEARTRADTAEARNNELVLENEALNTELDEMDSDLEEEEVRSAKLAKLCEKNVKTSSEFNEEMKMKRTKTYVAAPDKSNELHEIGHPTNILQPYHANSSGSTSFEIAREKLGSVIENSEGSGFGKKVKQLLSKFPEWEHHSCEVCGDLEPKNYYFHFFSDHHKKKVSALGAAVSTAALDYWMDKLKPEKEDQEVASAVLDEEEEDEIYESDSSFSSDSSDEEEEGEIPESVSSPAAAATDKAVFKNGVKGTVKWFEVRRGFGFITREDINENIFVHSSAFNNRSPGGEEKVMFDVVTGLKGPKATNVTFI